MTVTLWSGEKSSVNKTDLAIAFWWAIGMGMGVIVGFNLWG